MADEEDVKYLAICIYDESRGEGDEGKHAVARVVLNRANKKFYSDGTIRDTVLHKDQFSGFWFDFVDQKYTRVCHTMDEAIARAETKIAHAEHDAAMWSKCNAFAIEMLDGKYEGGPEYDHLTDDAILYANLAISDPAWAHTNHKIATVGHHTFFAGH